MRCIRYIQNGNLTKSPGTTIVQRSKPVLEFINTVSFRLSTNPWLIDSANLILTKK